MLNHPLTNTIPLHQQIKASLKTYFANFAVAELNHINNLYGLVKTEVEKSLIEVTLEHTQGNQSKAAKLLGISRNTLRKLLAASQS